jgi:3-deoxy-D-arabino-heptulosonate 7-phosphate (DAHP) synthase class II
LKLLLDGRITLARKVGHEVTSKSDEEGPSVEHIKKNESQSNQVSFVCDQIDGKMRTRQISVQTTTISKIVSES